MDGVSAPSGDVTFVFTDIEGSTRLLHRLQDGYVSVLERHREILRASWRRHGGYEVSVDGDAFFVAFGDAREAVVACVEAQRSLAAEEFPGGVSVRVRMGLHTGLASPHRGDYVALAVHQAARVAAAAHGGQVLVSHNAASAAGMPAELRPLGRYRLRDFEAPAALYELDPAGLGPFPAVRAMPADRHNIVVSRTPTVGRDELQADIESLLRPGAVVTLVGPGGVGKSRVASDVGVAVADLWDGGVWLVELADVADGTLVGEAVGRAVGVPATPGEDRWAEVLRYLSEHQMVLLLDNCEHLLTTVRAVVSDLARHAPGVAILATSREPLRVPGEQVVAVEPLEVPDDLTQAAASPAVRLFADRASAVRAGFVLTSENAADVAEICRQVDGLPLFVELAAANAAVQSPAEIRRSLDAHGVTARDPHLPGRHRSAAAVVDWSYRLLPEPEQDALRRLSVFGGSFTLDAGGTAVMATGGKGVDAALLIWSLVERSLVVADLSANATRYRLLETVRAFGREKLASAGETGEVSARLADWYLERLGPWLPADRRWVGMVGDELDNLRALIPLLGDVERSQLIASVIGRYRDATQAFREGIDELTRYVADLPRPGPELVSLLTALADLHLRVGAIDEAAPILDRAASLREVHGAPEWDEVGVDRTRGEIARRSGDLAGAVSIAAKALDRPLSDRGRSRMLNLWGTTSAALGEFEAAYRACAEELELNRALGYDGYVASAHGNLAEIALRLGDEAEAARHQRACLGLAVAQGSRGLIAFSLIVAARLAGGGGAWDVAVRLQSHADHLLEEIGLVLYDDDRGEIDRLLADARGHMSEDEYRAHRDEGAGWSTTEAVEVAGTVLDEAAAG